MRSKSNKKKQGASLFAAAGEERCRSYSHQNNGADGESFREADIIMKEEDDEKEGKEKLIFFSFSIFLFSAEHFSLMCYIGIRS